MLKIQNLSIVVESAPTIIFKRKLSIVVEVHQNLSTFVSS